MWRRAPRYALRRRKNDAARDRSACSSRPAVLVGIARRVRCPAGRSTIATASRATARMAMVAAPRRRTRGGAPRASRAATSSGAARPSAASRRLVLDLPIATIRGWRRRAPSMPGISRSLLDPAADQDAARRRSCARSDRRLGPASPASPCSVAARRHRCDPGARRGAVDQGSKGCARCHGDDGKRVTGVAPRPWPSRPTI